MCTAPVVEFDAAGVVYEILYLKEFKDVSRSSWIWGNVGYSYTFPTVAFI